MQDCRAVERQKPWRGNKMFVLLQSYILAKEVVWISLFILHTHSTLFNSKPRRRVTII